MSPVSIEMLNRGKFAGVIKVDPGSDGDLNMGEPISIKVNCPQQDRNGVVTVDGPQKALEITKRSSENDKNGIKQEVGKPISFQGSDIVEVSSPFFNESLKLTHKQTKRNIGNSPRQPA